MDNVPVMNAINCTKLLSFDRYHAWSKSYLLFQGTLYCSMFDILLSFYVYEIVLFTPGVCLSRLRYLFTLIDGLPLSYLTVDSINL